jgi:dihydroorotate dehydrogenase
VHDRESIRAVLAAGASAVQVGTAVLADPGVLWRLHRDSVAATEEMSR